MNPKLSLAQLFALKACHAESNKLWAKVTKRTARGLYIRKLIAPRYGDNSDEDAPELTLEGVRLLNEELRLNPRSEG